MEIRLGKRNQTRLRRNRRWKEFRLLKGDELQKKTGENKGNRQLRLWEKLRGEDWRRATGSGERKGKAVEVNPTGKIKLVAFLCNLDDVEPEQEHVHTNTLKLRDLVLDDMTLNRRFVIEFIGILKMETTGFIQSVASYYVGSIGADTVNSVKLLLAERCAWTFRCFLRRALVGRALPTHPCKLTSKVILLWTEFGAFIPISSLV
ncbi:hypothetical protein NE237_013741 [Protea cynaroides]|uniref:Uncharacterized protein n=1 Tax=Protea cynaroides TaxID=273540 RepID=A0A9Q0K0F8_9MAGN|nr:hypothetical protein NE237_013741 [Protea cynaroides]